MSTFAQQISAMSPLQLAYAAKEMRQKARLIDAEPIAIIGLGCRFPGADSPAAFWSRLHNGDDMITEVPPDRWPIDAYYDADPNAPGKMYTRQGGFVAQSPYDFDSDFFAISPREAASLDPQQRLLLEVSWEALEDAALSAEQLAGTSTGVFIGICSSDYFQRLVARGAEQIDHYLGTGNSASVAAGRLSYFLGLQGPSLAVDTACSSSLVTVHLACQSLRRGECDVALAGGVNRILSPELSVNFARARMLAPDGRCKTFDAAADGYVRGEGCGMVVLKRLSDARADGDAIVALIRGSAVNQDGRTSGLTVPNGPAQQVVIRQALDNGGVLPAQVGYVEAHGTGTALGDPIEVGALGEVFNDRSQPLLIGSVKTNFGHLEGAAGIAGLIKVALSLHHGAIPPHLHFQAPNPRIAWEQYKVQVATAVHPWPTGPKFAGVSAFGFSGTNAHVVLQEALPKKAVSVASTAPLHLLTLSAKSEAALDDLAVRYEHYLATTEANWADICLTSQGGRAHFPYRLAIVAANAQEALAKLRARRAGEAVVGVLQGQVQPNSQIAFLFTGQGSQYVGMGRALYDTHPLFRQTLDRCDELLRPYLGCSLLSILYPADSIGADAPDYQPSRIDETAYTQPALFALEYALVQLWKAWGIEPVVVMGHSVGELVAACVAGVFSLEDGLQLMAERGRLMQRESAVGEMAAVFADEAICAATLAPFADQLALAAINGPQNTVISGAGSALQQVIDRLAHQGVKSKRLTVSHAFHSPLLEPVVADFHRVARRLHYAAPQLDLVSNLTGELATGEITTADYWARQIRQPVRFADGMTTLHQMGANVFVEIGPKPVLLGMGQAVLPEDAGAASLWLPSLRPGAEWQHMLHSLAALYVRGVKINWSGVNGGNGAQRCDGLPTYAWQRERHGELPPATHQPPRQAPLAAAESWRDWLYELQWQPRPRLGGAWALPTASQLKSQLAATPTGIAPKLDLATIAHLEAVALDYIVAAFAQLGANLRPGARFSTAELIQRVGVVASQQQLFGRLLATLAAAGFLQTEDDQWTVINSPASLALSQAQQVVAPDASTEIYYALLDRCGQQLAEVLNGQCDPLQLLFPGGDLSLTTRLYEESREARLMNTKIQQVTAKALETLPPGQGLRILEIGAGTGSTTAHLLPSLPPAKTEYTFTDISPLFLAKAKEKFHAYPFVEYRLLNIEEEGAAQGFELHQYEIVVAANVLHATRSLRETVEHIRQLLAPGGLLILLEGTAPTRWLDLTFGLTEGWWRFTDRDLRPTYPLLSANAWQTLLRASGFAEAVTILQADNEQAVIVAQAAPAPAPATVADGHWLILAEQGGVGQQLAALLGEKGAKPVLAYLGDVYAQLSERTFSVSASPADLHRLLESIPNLTGVIHCWGLATPAALNLQSLKTASHNGAGSALAIVQALMAKGVAALPDGLWLVTRGAQAIHGPPTASGVAQAPLWGLGKVIALEAPKLWGGMIDLPAASSLKVDAATLLHEILTPSGEDHVAFRDQERYVARLTRLTADERTKQEGGWPIHREGSYLITGGLGKVGLKMATFLAAEGAQHLVLLGRSKPQDAARETLHQLEAQGVKLYVVQADVADEAQMRALLEKPAWPPLRGIVHCAAVAGAGDQTLMTMPSDTLMAALRPKGMGTWLLHHLTQSMDLDFFLCFSSQASILGSKGQGDYATANHFLDTFAHYGRGIGLPVLSVNLGLWDITGHGKLGAGFAQGLQQIGMQPLPDEQVFAALSYLLKAHKAQATLTNLNWAIYKPIYEAQGRHPLLEQISLGAERTSAAEQSLADAAPSFRQQLENAQPGERQARLTTQLQQLVAQVLGFPPGRSLPDPRQGLFDMGMDSLTAIELRNRLERLVAAPLRATLAFDFPTITHLAEHLAKDVLGWSQAPAVTASPQEATAGAWSTIEALSEEAVDESLTTGLAELESLLGI
ncbi:MAG: SDR family NAD(P)-dependent oxidoreductase [Caldilineaceae bacterium]